MAKKPYLPLPDNWDASLPLTNKKHELFCNEVINAPHGVAYYKVYDPDHKGPCKSSHMTSAWQTLRIPKVKARHNYLLHDGLVEASLGRQERLNQLRRMIALAEEEGNHTAVKGYHELIVKMFGEGVEKVDITSAGKGIDGGGANITVTTEAVTEALNKFGKDF